MRAFHALAGDEFIGDLAEHVGRALHEKHFEHVIVFQQDVLRGNHLGDVLATDT
jgi:hypothetical protein